MLLLVLIPYVTFMSCRKGAGEGGRASIKGKVYAINYNSTMTVAQDSGYMGAQKVYIIYGDQTAVSRSQDSNHDGTYEFMFLRKGKYKVYTFSKTAPNQLDSAVIHEGEITERKQTLELPDLRIKTTKN